MTLFDVSENVSPVLSNGSFDVHFPKFERITSAIVGFDQSNNIDSSGMLCMSYNYNPNDKGSYNWVTVWFKHFDASNSAAIVAGRKNATTAMLAGKKVVVLAFSDI